MDYLSLFNDFVNQEYNEGDIWQIQSADFKAFWNMKITNKKINSISEIDIDPIIRYLDQKAKGNTKNNISVARTGIRMGMWYRAFKSLKENDVIQDKFNSILSSNDDALLIKLINELDEINRENKNCLTGKNGIIINAILVLNNPSYFFSVVSLAHRQLILKYFDFGDIEKYNGLGEKIIQSNRLLLDGFKKLGIDGSPREISCFLYSKIKSYWHTGEIDIEEASNSNINASQDISNENIFTIEKYFEDFLIGNWESTELGKKYDLIMDNGELKSQQYQTDIGRIDILVKEKNTDNFVVIELKRGQTSDDTIGQLARYIGWVKDKLCKNGNVKGIIVAHELDEKLRYALKAVPNTEYYNYKINFSLNKL